jgi:hypothetical protein
MIIFNSLLKLVVKAFSVRTTLTTDDKGEIDVYLSNYGSSARLIGDFRKKGLYTCIARDIRDPENTRLIQEIIKIQHNVRSNLKKYSLGLIRIIHEHVLIWRKKSV